MQCSSRPRKWQRQRRRCPFSCTTPLNPPFSPSCLLHCCPPMLQMLSSLQKWFAQIISVISVIAVVHWVFRQDAQPAHTVPGARRTRGSRGHGTYTRFFLLLSLVAKVAAAQQATGSAHLRVPPAGHQTFKGGQGPDCSSGTAAPYRPPVFDLRSGARIKQHFEANIPTSGKLPCLRGWCNHGQIEKSS